MEQPVLFPTYFKEVLVMSHCLINVEHWIKFIVPSIDKEFSIQDWVLAQQAKVFITTFLEKRDSFTKEEIILTKGIGKVCIYVDCFNERFKK